MNSVFSQVYLKLLFGKFYWIWSCILIYVNGNALEG